MLLTQNWRRIKKKRLYNTFNFSDNDINQCFWLRKDVYSYEYMDECEKFNVTSLPEKEELHWNLNMKYVIDASYMHAKIVCKNFEIKNLVEYHYFYLKSDTLFLADVLWNLRKMCLRTYHVDPAK